MHMRDGRVAKALRSELSVEVIQERAAEGADASRRERRLDIASQ